MILRFPCTKHTHMHTGQRDMEDMIKVRTMCTCVHVYMFKCCVRAYVQVLTPMMRKRKGTSVESVTLRYTCTGVLLECAINPRCKYNPCITCFSNWCIAAPNSPYTQGTCIPLIRKPLPSRFLHKIIGCCLNCLISTFDG